MSETQITREEIAETIAKAQEQSKASERLIRDAEAFLDKVQKDWQKQSKELFGLDEKAIEEILERSAPELRAELETDPISVLERRLLTAQSCEEEELLANILREDLADQQVIPSVFNGQKKEMTTGKNQGAHHVKRMVSKI